MSDDLGDYYRRRNQLQLGTAMGALAEQLQRSIKALDAIRDVSRSTERISGTIHEVTERVARARDLADLLEMTSARALRRAAEEEELNP